MTEVPKTMRAWTQSRTGAPREALTLNPSSPTPPPPTGSNLLIQITHAGLNPADLHLLSVVPIWLPFRRTPTPGMDFVGSIVAAGPSAPPEMKVGVTVCGALGVKQLLFGAGTLAEYVIAPADQVAIKPERLSAAQAVGLGVAGQTAALVVREAGEVKGKKVLVNGASGGVGTILLQILKAKGAHVTAVCSASNEAFVKGLGADDVIDYTAYKDLYAHLTDTYLTGQPDLIVDCVGDDTLFRRSPSYLKPDGKFLSIVGRAQGIYSFLMHQVRPTLLGGTPRSYKILGLAPSGTAAREVAQLVNDGLVNEILVDSEYTMGDALLGFERLATKRAKGKIVIKVQE